ncbi:cyd operon YbgE family protein [Acinetobacter sp. MD2]|uniref:cyd operon YbgE family protein n=1 Tax=Acinetobacter sp. MD2 TaxID=2600066 RepID=UPI002D1ED832|nr:cyd operon YbgE family protein [Acinetobacter sp. MD2]MEB3766334.1 cyd operon YbgE family protein [Acinetobacter sp. MD2]
MADAMTTPQSKETMRMFIMITSFTLALPLAAILMIYPSLMLDANGHYSHPLLMLVMLGISGGFIYGVGFKPQFWLWKWLFSPFISWPLMGLGYFIWLS